MIAVSSYVVEVDDENRYFGGSIELTNDIEVLPVSGIIHQPPLLESIEPGSRIFFQWNALLEPAWVEGKLLLDRDYVYRIGDQMVNNWLWVEITEQLDGLCNAKVIASPVELYGPGDIVIFERMRAHRIETQGFNTLNPHGMPLYALYWFDILAI